MSDIFLSVDGDTRPLEAKLGKISSKGINFNLKDGISQPLGKISGNVSEFNKSLEASNARVLAFGASAGAVYGITRAFKEMVTATIEVEKSLADINVVLNASSSDLSKFGSELFNIAKNTGQSFGEVAKAATELSRQGLGIAETLKRTSDALILTRLSGLDAAASVQTLTAAVNGFARAGLTTTEIINKFATVDAAFAVSTADLANGLSRVGSAAQDAGVNIDELVALITSAQQNTARGGAVIGNAFKTIFTRLQRTDTLDKLEETGIAVRDLQGNTLPAIQILKNLSDVFYKLSDSQRASIAETVGGVFQINVLKAALGDLTKQYSVYDNALRISSASTNQAIKRNEALNQTLSSLVNKTFVNLKQTGANVGEITISPAIKKGASLLNPLLEGFNKEGDSQSAGVKVAKGILTGLGSYLSGPGLALVGAVFLKIFGRLTSFSADALKGLLGITNVSDKIAQAQSRITAILAQNPSLIQAIISKETSLLQVENQILSIIQAQNAARSAATRVAVGLAPKVAYPTSTTKTGKTKSGGFIPNFSAEMQEIMGAKEGGYKPGNVRGMNIPGEGNIIYNSAESVVKYPGAKQPAIVPPENSKAGKDYRKKFQNEAGFDPYAAFGFVPNFANNKIPKSLSLKEAIEGYNKGIYSRSQLSNKYGVKAINQELGLSRVAASPTKQDINLGYTNRLSMIYPAKTGLSRATGIFKDAEDNKYRVSFTKSGFNAKTAIKPEDAVLKDSLGKTVIDFVNNYISQLSNGKFQKIGNIDQLANTGAFGSIVGTVFETAVTYATQSLKARAGGQSALIDFPNPNENLKELFNQAPGDYEAKGNDGQELANDVARKIYQAGFVNSKIQKRSLAKKTKSRGFVPNFSALQDAIKREKEAGVDPNKIRVDSNDALISKNNPLGLGVYNTKDEPNGLKQGIDRVKSKGFVPNFADSKTTFEDKYQSRLLAVSIGLSTLQGVISQFGDQTSQSARNLQQLTLAAANLTTGLGISKRFGGLIAGGLLMNQAQSMRQESATKPYTEALGGLGKEMDSLRSESGKLEGVFSKVKEQTNAYSEELDKAFPDASKIQEFRSNILNAISSLGPELRQQIMDQMPTSKMYDKETPGNITNTLGKAGSNIASKMDLKALTSDLVNSSLETIKAQSDYDGFFSKGIRAITGDKSERPNNKFFENPDAVQGATSSILGNIMSDSSKATSAGLLSVANSLKQNNQDGNAFVQTLQSLSPKTAETNAMFKALNSTLSQSPQGINAIRQNVLDSLEKLLTGSKLNVEAAIKAGQGSTREQYGDINKLFNGKTLATPQGNGKQILDLMATSGEVAMYRDRKDPLMQGRAAGGFLQQLNSLGISSDKLKEFAPDLVKANEESNRMDIEKTMNEVIAGLKRASKDFTPEKEKAFREKFGGDTGLFSKVGQKKAGEALTSGTFGPVEASLENLKTVTIAASDQLPSLTSEFQLLEEAIKSLRQTIQDNKNAPPAFSPSKARTAGDNLEEKARAAASEGNTGASTLEKVAIAGGAINLGSGAVKLGRATLKGIQKAKNLKTGGKFGMIGAAGAATLTSLASKFLTPEEEVSEKPIEKPKGKGGTIPAALSEAESIKNAKPSSGRYNIRDPKTGRFIKATEQNLSKTSLKAVGKGFSKSNLLLNTIFAGMQYKDNLDEGYSPLQSALLTGSSFAGGLVGGAGGAAAGTFAGGPVGTAIGGVGGSIAGSTLAENFAKKFIKKNEIKSSQEASTNPTIGGGTLMTENGISVGPETSKINEALSNKFAKFPMGSYQPIPETPEIPEISRPAPSKFEKLQSYFQNSEMTRSKMGGDSRLNYQPPPAELMKGMNQEQQHNAQVMALQNIMSGNASEKGYSPRNYGEKIAPYKRAIDELEGGQPARYGRFIEGQGFEKLGGFIGNYEKTRQKQMSKGFSSKNQRIEGQRGTGMIDNGFAKGYATYGADGKLTPETQVTSRNYDNETGMIKNQTNEGNIGLESSVLQDEKKIFLDQMGKKYDKKSAQTMLQSLMNQKGKDKNGRTGFQNLQAHNRVNSPNIATPKLQGPEFLKDNIPMYGQNLQAGLLFGQEQTTDQNKSLMGDEYIASSKSFDNTKGYDLNTRSNQEKTNTAFTQYDNPKEYMPPKDFFQPTTTLESKLAEAQGNLSQIPMGSMSEQQMKFQNPFLPQTNNMIGQSLGSGFGFNQNPGTSMNDQGLGSEFPFNQNPGTSMNNLGNPLGQMGMMGNSQNFNITNGGISNDLQQVLQPSAGGALALQGKEDRGVYDRQEKTNLAFSPTNPELKMQEAPKEKNKEKQGDDQNSISKIFGSLNKEMANFSEKVKAAAESLGKMNKEGSKDQEGKEKKDQSGQGKKEEIKINDIKASVTVSSTPDTKTEAKVAAISKVIEELKKELEQLKGKVTNNVNPPSAMRG